MYPQPPKVTVVSSSVSANCAKQQKMAKKEQDSKSKKLVNDRCYIHAKYGIRAQKWALPEKCLHRNQVGKIPMTVLQARSHLNNEIQTYNALYEDQILYRPPIDYLQAFGGRSGIDQAKPQQNTTAVGNSPEAAPTRASIRNQSRQRQYTLAS